MKIFLIRHSITKGNLEKRYIGTTDECLCEEGKQLLEQYRIQGIYPDVERVFVSPKRRCLETAELLYPGKQLQIIRELAECDFGLFENKNHEELEGLAKYQAWLRSNGTLPFPDGESREAFAERCVQGFERACLQCRKEQVGSAAFIVHGGTIMSIMEAYALPKGSYYEFMVGNGKGYELYLPESGRSNYRAL